MYYGKLGVMRVVTSQLGFTRPFSIRWFFLRGVLFQLSYIYCIIIWNNLSMMWFLFYQILFLICTCFWYVFEKNENVFSNHYYIHTFFMAEFVLWIMYCFIHTWYQSVKWHLSIIVIWLKQAFVMILYYSKFVYT